VRVDSTPTWRQVSPARNRPEPQASLPWALQRQQAASATVAEVNPRGEFRCAVSGSDERLGKGSGRTSGPRVRETPIHPPEIAPTSGPCQLSARQLDASERAVSAGCASGVLRRPALTVGEPFEQALAHALDALR
jgi:hypothetical protein